MYRINHSYKNNIYIIAYDFSDNKKRNKISKILENYGTRIQKSVFQCSLNKGQLHFLKEKLINELNNYADSEDDNDSLIIFEDVKKDNILYIETKASVPDTMKAYQII